MYLLNFTKVALNEPVLIVFVCWMGSVKVPYLALFHFVFVLTRNWPVWVKVEQVVTFVLGALVYADDLVLLAPSANAMRHMSRLCNDYAAQFNVVFNASKSKCLSCSPAGAAKQVTPADSLPSFSIGSRVIEFCGQMGSSGSYHNEGVYRYRRHT